MKQVFSKTIFLKGHSFDHPQTIPEDYDYTTDPLFRDFGT